MNDVTAIIKTFMRPQCVKALVTSIQRQYPKLRILIADDSREPLDMVANIKVIPMPFDSGLSAGRNLLVSKVETPYFLLLDDDFVFTYRTKIDVLKRALDAGFDISAGAVLGREYAGLLIREGNTLLYKKGNRGQLGGFPIYDLAYNFFLAKTDSVRQVMWDEDLKLAEHTDFFLRAKEAGLKVTSTRAVNVDHSQSRAGDYGPMRKRGVYFGYRFMQKWGFERTVGFTGDEMTLEGYRKKAIAIGMLPADPGQVKPKKVQS